MVRKSAIRHRLKVVFDTNSLWTQRIDDLLSEAAAELIRANSSHVDMEIEWILPEMALLERRRQMLSEAQKHVPGLNKIERLLGVNWAITPENLAFHIDKSIEKKLSDLRISVKSLDSSRVLWGDIIRLAGSRLPPFEVSDGEKGFKDAMIGETFLQLVEDWIPADQKNKAILVCKDGLLSEWVKDRLPEGRRARVVPDIQALKNDLNVFGSSVEPEFAMELVKMAMKLFFDQDKKEGLYYSGDVYTKAHEKFSAELKLDLPGSSGSEIKTVFVRETIFLSKASRDVTFSTNLEFSVEAYSYIEKNESISMPVASTSEQLQIGFAPIGVNTKFPMSLQLTKPEWTARGKGLLSGFGLDHEKVKMGEKTLSVDVVWSASLSQARRLTSPRVKDLALSTGN